jgi:hypothetical protein
MKHGVKLPGNENDALTRLREFEQLCGRNADLLLVFLSGDAWSSTSGQFLAADYFRPRYEKLEREILWSVPLIPQKDLAAAKTNVGEVLGGKRDAEFTRCATSLAKLAGTDPIYLRLGWESNGNWYAWGTPNIGASAYRDLFRYVAQLFRKVSDRFRFVYNISVLASDSIDSAYPGDSIVDVISADVYWQSKWQDVNPALAWEKVLTSPVGLQPVASYAAAKAKPFAIDEWGVSTGGEAFVTRFAQWIGDTPLWECYWNSNSAYPGMLDFATNTSTRAWIQAFGAYGLRLRELVTATSLSLSKTAAALSQVSSEVSSLTKNLANAKTEIEALKQEAVELEGKYSAALERLEKVDQLRDVFKSFLA